MLLNFSILGVALQLKAQSTLEAATDMLNMPAGKFELFIDAGEGEYWRDRDVAEELMDNQPYDPKLFAGMVLGNPEVDTYYVQSDF